jgi:hypothetical protein
MRPAHLVATPAATGVLTSTVERLMKKKGPKAIPDFSSKRKDKSVPGQPSVVPDQENNPKAHAPVTTRNVKPASTSSKAGRRGG